MAADTIAAAIQTVEGGFSSPRSDLLAIEEPLQFCLNGFPLSITMRSPGSDLDLGSGFCFGDSNAACKVGLGGDKNAYKSLPVMGNI